MPPLNPRPFLVVLAVAALAGCTPEPAPTPTRAPAPAPAPEPEPDPAPPPPAYGEDTFSTSSLDRYEAFSVRPGSWYIRAGTLLAEGDAHHGALIRRDVAIGNGWVEATSIKSDDGGLIVRFQDDGNYYMLGFRDDGAPYPRGERNLQLYRRRDGDFEELTVQDIHWPRGERRTVRLRAAGATLQVYVDGRFQHEWRDPDTPLPPGRIGMRHHGEEASWVTTFDLFRWSQSDR